ncbi:MAG: hypothetical protein L6R39_002974, partial [Caloplaca ligustica]
YSVPVPDELQPQQPTPPSFYSHLQNPIQTPPATQPRPPTSPILLTHPPMGFATGALSGFTLTASTLYLTILIHNRHRIHQASLLYQQSLLLNSIVEPSILPPEDNVPRYRIERANWTERWKDGWNKEIEDGVRWVQGIRWKTVREAAEGRWREWREGERRV